MNKVMINRILLLAMALVCVGSLRAQETPLRELTLELGAQSTVTGGYVSLTEAFGYTDLEGYYYSEGIDFVYLHGKTTGANLLVPTNDEGFSAFSKSMLRKMQTWKTRNDGILIKLNATDARAAFNEVETESDLEDLINNNQRSVTGTPGYKPLLHGPGTRLTQLNPGDLVLFKSKDSDRAAIAYIQSIAHPGTRASMTLALKYKL